MIITSCHKNFQSDKFITYAISGNRGKNAKYIGKCFPQLAPKLAFWKIWHNNIGIIPEEENNRYYIEQYYKEVLSILNPEEIYKKLDNSALLCYENNNEFCHRHIVAAWFELLLDIEVPEVKANNYSIEYINRPTYIKEELEKIIKKEKNIKQFNSLHAFYLFEKSETLKQKNPNKYYNDNILSCEAEQIEQNYKLKRKSITKK